MEDEKIIDLFWARDQRAINETNVKYGKRLQKLAERILQRLQDAEECVSDTYFRTWNTIPPTRPQHLYAYLAKICRLVSYEKLDWLNAQKRSAEVVSLSAELELCIPAGMEDHQIESQEIGRLLDVFLGTLKKEQRVMFVRRYWYGYSISEIAQTFGIGESKAKTSLFRTRNKLRDFLEREGVDL